MDELLILHWLEDFYDFGEQKIGILTLQCFSWY